MFVSHLLKFKGFARNKIISSKIALKDHIDIGTAKIVSVASHINDKKMQDLVLLQPRVP